LSEYQPRTIVTSYFWHR